MNNYNNDLLGFALGVIIFIAVILFMVLLIYIEVVFITILKKINSILKRKNQSSDSTNKDK